MQARTCITTTRQLVAWAEAQQAEMLGWDGLCLIWTTARCLFCPCLTREPHLGCQAYNWTVVALHRRLLAHWGDLYRRRTASRRALHAHGSTAEAAVHADGSSSGSGAVEMDTGVVWGSGGDTEGAGMVQPSSVPVIRATDVQSRSTKSGKLGLHLHGLWARVHRLSAWLRGGIWGDHEFT